jgi:thioredoxin 1
MEMTLTEQTFQKEVLESKLPVLVDFWAPWCGPCSIISPVIEELANAYEGKLKVGKVNVDEESNIASQYQIMSIPTLMIFKDGQKVDQIIGALPKATLEETIKKYI